MISRLLLLTLVIGWITACRSRDIRESHVITDLSKPVTLYFKFRSNKSNAGLKINGTMNGSLGYASGFSLEEEEMPSEFKSIDNLSEADSIILRKFRVASDSVSYDGNVSIGQGGLYHVVHIIPGTATKGRIEIEFWEHPIGFY